MIRDFFKNLITFWLWLVECALMLFFTALVIILIWGTVTAVYLSLASLL